MPVRPARNPEFAGCLQAGQAVGPYRLISPLGAGGMAEVWLARRDDGAFKRDVALKLPTLGGSRGLHERMRRERDILASLAHANIARYYRSLNERAALARVIDEARPYRGVFPLPWPEDTDER